MQEATRLSIFVSKPILQRRNLRNYAPFAVFCCAEFLENQLIAEARKQPLGPCHSLGLNCETCRGAFFVHFAEASSVEHLLEPVRWAHPLDPLVRNTLRIAIVWNKIVSQPLIL